MPTERNLILSKPFERSYQKFTDNNQSLKESIARALIKLQQDAFDPALRTHKLSGKLAAYLSCSCGYDCQIIFTIVKGSSGKEIEKVLLLDIGTHDDVY